MLFTTLTFFVFFVVVFSLFFFVLRTRALKLWLIILSSILFYCFWDVRVLPILLGTALIDFYIARGIQATQDERRKRRLVMLSVGANLTVLAVFKYLQFLTDNVVSVLGLLGFDVSRPVLSIVLPIGISFYTFQSISYVVDVYRGVFKPRKRFLDFLGALTFFPHLVAGPIVRSSFILPQFETFKAPKWDDCQRAFLLIAFGLAKKSVADLLGDTVDNMFNGLAPLSRLDSWTGALGFVGQMYGDFSGYTDIAIGVALLLGFQLPKNFDLPYLSRNVIEFWSRWHMSLSTWLRDYLYTPLAGRSRFRARYAVIPTMFVSGLWHGAGWTFVVWGLYHGILLFGTNLVLERTEDSSWTRRIPTWFQIGLTFYLVTIGMVVFRAATLGAAWEYLRAMHAPLVASTIKSSSIAVLLLVVTAIVSCHAIDYLATRTRTHGRPWVLWTSIVLAVGFSMCFGTGGKAFIYFQF